MLLKRFIAHILEKKLFSPADRLLLAVSGGVDSIVLCHLCHHAGFSFQMAHANFQLRGQESMLDECFVKGVSEQLHATLHIKKFDTTAYAAEHKVSVQVAARELRYAWFNELLVNTARYVVTAHHADDNIETVMMHFFRGTGISGLRGMLPKHDNIVRPLLSFSKQELLAYAKEKKLNWREDSSNAYDKYSRNYFRSSILPMVYRVYPEAEANILRNIARLEETEQLYHQAIDAHKKKLLVYKGNEVHIPVLKLKKVIPLHSILFEIIRPYHFTSHQLDEVVRLLDAEQGAHVRSSTHRIFRNRNWLIISPMVDTASHNILIRADEKEVSFNEHVMQWSFITADHDTFSKDSHVAELDGGRVKFPLLLRKWKAGDYFYPLGMKKKKKVSRFLIDNKLSPTDKEKVWVVESDKRICWVVGMRIDERFKVVASTKRALRLSVRS